MKFSASLLVAVTTLASLSTASPAPVAEPLPEISERDTLAKRGNEASCQINNPNGDANSNADIWINTKGYWANDWGKGLLDNLRGQCGDIYGWEFWYEDGDNSKAGTAHFYAYHWNVLKNWDCNGYPFCSNNCIENAVWLASNAAADGAIWNFHCKIPGVNAK